MKKTDLLYGIHAVQTALAQTPRSIVEIWLDHQRQDKRIAEIQRLASRHGMPQHEVTRQQLDHLLPGVNHQGVIAHCKMPGVLAENDLFAMIEQLDKPALLLILDGVQDPHNLGACL
ncbi:MAG: 23S rRNA methyltransferase, partial [Gammaproteobacteria bacterium SG8_11]